MEFLKRGKMGTAFEANPSGMERPLVRPPSRMPGKTADGEAPASRPNKMAQPKSLRSQRVKRPDEARGERLGAHRMGRSPVSPGGDKRDSLGDSRGPPSRTLSSKSTPRWKQHRESPLMDGAKKAAVRPAEGSHTPRGSQLLLHDESCNGGGPRKDELCLCPSIDQAQDSSPRSSSHGPSGGTESPRRDTCPRSRLPPAKTIVAAGGMESPRRDTSPRSRFPPAETLVANLQKQNFELMRQNALLRQALLKHISKKELLFLLAYSTTNAAGHVGDDRTPQGPSPSDVADVLTPRGPSHTLRGFAAADASATRLGSHDGEEEQNCRPRSINLPCVKNFFMAMQCCSGLPHEPLPAPERTPETAAENSSPLETLTTCEGGTGTKDVDDFSPIAVDFDPFEVQREDETDIQSPTAEPESHCSTMPSSTMPTNMQRRSLEDGSVVPLPVGRTSHWAPSLVPLAKAPSHVKPRAARGSMFYPSAYRFATQLPQAFPQ